jgi:hypothetical protein
MVNFASVPAARNSPPIPRSSSSLPCPRSPPLPLQYWSHRHRPKVMSCHCRLFGDHEYHTEVRGLPFPLHSPPLLPILCDCSSKFRSATVKPPHCEPSSSGAPTPGQPPPSDFPQPSPSSQIIPAALRPLEHPFPSSPVSFLVRTRVTPPLVARRKGRSQLLDPRLTPRTIGVHLGRA